MSHSFLKKIAPAGAIVVLVSGMAALMSNTIITDDYVAVEVRSGDVQDNVLQSGQYWQIPYFRELVKLPSGSYATERKGLSAASSDNYAFSNAHVRASMRLDTDSAMQLYNMYGEQWRSRINKALSSAFNIAAGRLELFEIARDRKLFGDYIAKEFQRILNEELNAAKSSDPVVKVTNAHLVHFEWDKSARRHLDRMQEALEKERIAEAEYKAEKQRSRQRKEQAQSNAEQERIAAMQAAENRKRKAKAEAEAIRVRAQAEVERLRKLANVLEDNPELLNRLAIEAWSEGGAQVPMVMGGAQGGVRLNLGQELVGGFTSGSTSQAQDTDARSNAQQAQKQTKQ